MSARLTKAQLLARIEEIEREYGMAKKTIEQLEAEMASVYVRERPSRRPHHTQWDNTVVVPVQSTEHRRVVYLRGVPHYKVQDARTRVVTYKPLAQ